MRVSTSTPGFVLEQTPVAGTRSGAGSVVDLVISQLGSGEVIVPNVVGKPVSDARTELQNLGLVVDSPQTKADTKQPKGHVIQQNPKAQKTAKVGSTIKLVISGGDLVEIPNVRGKELDDARKKITSGNKLTVGRIDYRPDCRVNEVIEQDPLPSNEKTADRGTAVNLTVASLGDNPVTIPTFRDRTSAQDFVSENRLTLKRVREEENEAAAGTVLRQSPRPGRQFGRNCPVDVELTVAIPIVWIDIENYVNQPVDVVQQKLRGLEVHSLVRYQQYPDATPGTVIQQSPAGPTRVKHWSYVYLVVARQPQVQTVMVPDLCGKPIDVARAILKNLGLVAPQDQDLVPANQVGWCADNLKVGNVVWQYPAANSPAPKGSTVKLAVRPIE